MIQTWILPDGTEPTTAVRTGVDASVCGACPLRPLASGGCYVVPFQGPNSVARQLAEGAYSDGGVRSLVGRAVRIGAWGDPVAVPSRVWRDVVRVARTHTGYTSSWRTRGAWRYREFLMASVRSLEGAREAWARGWRTYRVVPKGEPSAAGEIDCPNTATGVSCLECRLCDGAGGRPSLTIEAHGYKASRVFGS